jgi:hypothetical protein
MTTSKHDWPPRSQRDYVVISNVCLSPQHDSAACTVFCECYCHDGASTEPKPQTWRVVAIQVLGGGEEVLQSGITTPEDAMAARADWAASLHGAVGVVFVIRLDPDEGQRMTRREGDPIPWPVGSLERAAYELVEYLRDAIRESAQSGDLVTLPSGEAMTLLGLADEVDEALAAREGAGA